MTSSSSRARRGWFGRWWWRPDRRADHGRLFRPMLESLEARRMLSVAEPHIELFGVWPPLFVENQGQWAEEGVRFLYQGRGFNVAMTDAGPVFQAVRREVVEDEFLAQDQTDSDADTDGPGDDWPGERSGNRPDRFDADRYRTETLVFSASFMGAARGEPVGRGASEAVFNYFVGEQANWRSEVPAYRTVAYEGLYAGIDLHARGLRSSLKYEFHVAPGSDWSQIAIRYEGIVGLSLADDGSLVVDLGDDWGELLDAAPHIYQMIDGREVRVAGRFALLDDRTYTFEISGAFDSQHPLVIDPDLVWSTYLGGGAGDFGRGIASDAAGSILVTGYTDSNDFAGANNSYHGGDGDAFVAKVSPSGSLQWTTYLGGNNSDIGRGIAVDATGNAVVTGCTGSTDFAGTNNAYHGGEWDAFVAEVSPEGLLQWATYLGGGDSDEGHGIALDAAGDALVTGNTDSNNFAGVNNSAQGGSDAFVAKISPAGLQQWATYLGGSSWDYGRGIAADAAGHALVIGSTRSDNLVGAINSFSNPFNNGVDAFVAKVSAGGSLQWATYLGGEFSCDHGHGIAVDAGGNALVTGESDFAGLDGDYETWHGGYDAFVAKIAPWGALRWAMYLGGGGDDYGYGIAVDAADNAMVTGDTRSDNFEGAKNSYRGGNDGFVAKVSSGGALSWALYLGGSGSDSGYGIALDPWGNAVVMGHTDSTDLEGANSSYKGGSRDGFLAKIAASSDDIAGRLVDGRWYVAASRGQSFDTQYWGLWGAGDWTDVMSGDFNADGGADVVGRLGNRWYVGLNTGMSFATTYWGRWGDGEWTDVIVGDFTGDGRDDVAGRLNSRWYVLASTGISFQTAYWGLWGAGDWTDVLVGDFAGDSRDDIAGRWNNRWYVASSTGASFQTTYWGVWSAGGWTDVLVGDFTGDGRDDIAGQLNKCHWYVASSTGTSFSTNQWTFWRFFSEGVATAWSDVRAGDFDGDGRSNIAGRTNDGRWVVTRSDENEFLTEYWGLWDPNANWLDVLVDDFRP